jgi:hypothetical protein
MTNRANPRKNPAHPDLPAQAVLRAAFDQVVNEINQQRNITSAQKDQLCQPFYKAVGDAVFEASFEALCDGYDPAQATIADTDRNRLHLISAPVGSGKSTFTIAFLAAVARTYPKIGCLLAIDRIERADDCYHQLKSLIPGKVAIWTVDHDPTRRKANDPERKVHVAKEDRYSRRELRHFPIIIITHAMFSGTHQGMGRQWDYGQRQFMAIDERLDDWIIWDIKRSDAVTAQEIVAERPGKTDKIADEHLRTLVIFIDNVRKHIGNNLSSPSGDGGNDLWSEAAKELHWFTTDQAHRYNHRLGQYRDVQELVRNIEDATREQRCISGVFGFARGLAQGCAFATGGNVPHFLAYEPSRPLPPGCLLLDATADIDHLNEICAWRKPHRCPAATYQNLTVIAVSIPDKFPKSLAPWLSKSWNADENRAAYAEWINQVVNRYLKKGQRGLLGSRLIKPTIPEPQRDTRRRDSYAPACHSELRCV